MSSMSRSTTETRLTTHDLVLFALFAVLITVGAYIRVPIPYVPFTLQVLFTTLAGLLLGGKRGAMAVSLYVLLGLIGVPVFTQGGGPSYILQPSFGYLLGFIGGAYVTGRIAHSSKTPSLARLIMAGFVGLAIVYICGMVYVYMINDLYLGTPIGLYALFLYCFLLIIPGDIVLVIVAALLGKRLLPLIRK